MPSAVHSTNGHGGRAHEKKPPEKQGGSDGPWGLVSGFPIDCHP